MTRQLNNHELEKRIKELEKETKKRKQAEEALKESEKKFRILAEASAVGIFIIQNLKFIYVNPAVEGIFEEDFETLLKRGPLDYTHPDYHLASEKYIMGQFSENPDKKPFHFKGLNANGKEIYCEVQARGIEYQGNPTIIGTLMDITERNRAREQILQERNFSEKVINSLPSTFYMFNTDGKIVRWNQNFEDVSEYSSEEIAQMKVEEYIADEYKEATINAMQEVFSMGESSVESRALTKSGKEIPYFFSAKRVEIDGEMYLIGTGMDITERKRSEEALSESEEKYRVLVENAGEVILVAQDGLFKFVNRRVVDLLGYNPEELVGKPFSDYIHPEDIKIVADRHMKRLKGEDLPGVYPFRVVNKQGESRWVEIKAVRIEWEGEPATLNFLADITDRKRIEEALLESEEKYRILVEESPLAVSLIGKDGRYRYLNPKFIELFGYTLSEIPTGLDWFRKVYPDKEYRKKAMSTWIYDQKKYDIGEARPRIYVLTCKDGSIKTISFRPVTMKTGDQLVIYEDVTERQRLESELRQAQKMEAVGTLAGGIAHDFNNLLQAIIGYTQIVMMEREQGDPELERLREIEKAAIRARELTQQLLTFSRRVESKPRPLDLNQEVRQVEKLIKRTIPKMIGIRLELQEGLNVVNADPVQVEQIVMNLCLNARDAMPDGGTLMIETENVTLDEAYCRSHIGAVPGDYVLLTISDTGHGMDKETVEHIFEPFFTTKETGKGTGLGLSMVYGIVKSHGGYIMCYSEPGEGTSFKIYFRTIEVESGSMNGAADKEKEEDLQQGIETILLVEDESFLRVLGKQMLERFGYTVITANKGESALEIYKEKGRSVDLVILDLIMPGMGGKKCLEELLRINPSISVLIASGFSATGPTREALDAGAKGFISKPYELKKMLKLVREVLDKE